MSRKIQSWRLQESVKWLFLQVRCIVYKHIHTYVCIHMFVYIYDTYMNIYFVVESICFALLFVCNYLGIAGIKSQVWLFISLNLGLRSDPCKAPYLLVPWLGVYMVGIISCYIAAFMWVSVSVWRYGAPVCMRSVSRYLLTTYYQDSTSYDLDPMVPAATGLVFHFLWYFIKNIFCDLRRDLRYGSVSRMKY